MTKQRWLHLSISGIEAEALLMKQEAGAFLVRPSQSRPNQYTVSVRTKTQVTHFHIYNSGDCYTLNQGNDKDEYGTLVDLVHKLMESPSRSGTGDGEEVIELKTPVPSPEPTNERWFHGFLSGPDAESLLMSRGRTGSYLVRESRTQPGNYVLCVKTDDKVMDNKVMNIIIRKKAGENGDPDLYDFGREPNFNGLQPLIANYLQSPIIDVQGNVITLKSALNTTRFEAHLVGKRIEELQKAQAKSKSGFMEEFEQLQEQDTVTRPKRAGQLGENRAKNRYRNILPYDHTRVKLVPGVDEKPGKKEMSNYINANYITYTDEDEQILSSEYVNSVGVANGMDHHIPGDQLLLLQRHKLAIVAYLPTLLPPKKMTYIATQGCQQDTVVDFYRMVLQEMSAVVLMITKIVERGKNKCYQYWPSMGKKLDFSLADGSKLVVSLSEELEFEHWTERKILVKKDKEEPHEVIQFHFTSWPDHGCPTEADSILQLMKHVNAKQEPKPINPPIIVHCSAGIGRSGTYIVIDMLLDIIKAFGVDTEVDVQRTVQICRQQRSGIVQTEAQYKFIYIVLERAVQRIQDGEEIQFAKPK